jgi:hypothetical protein
MSDDFGKHRLTRRALFAYAFLRIQWGLISSAFVPYQVALTPASSIGALSAVRQPNLYSSLKSVLS